MMDQMLRAETFQSGRRDQLRLAGVIRVAETPRHRPASGVRVSSGWMEAFVARLAVRFGGEQGGERVTPTPR